MTSPVTAKASQLESQPTPRRRLLTSLVVACRPRQWIKNILVVAAPLAGGVLLEVDVLVSVAVSFMVFCLAASGTYLINDVMDIEEDRRHPTKRRRPVAAGELPIVAAAVAGVALLVLAATLAAVATTWSLFVLVVSYEVISLAYCLWLKHEPVLDIAVVASGFLFRAMAGGLAADVALSQWFLLVAAFGALFMVAGKRYSELRLAAAEGGQTRRSLRRYSASYLRFVWGLAASVTVTSYSLWAFDIRATDEAPWAAISIIPFVLSLLRYAVDIDSGQAGEPEDIVLRDRVLQGLGVAWVVLLSIAVAS